MVIRAGRSARRSAAAARPRSSIDAARTVPIPSPRRSGRTDPLTCTLKAPSAAPAGQHRPEADQLVALEGAHEVLADLGLGVVQLLGEVGGAVVLAGVVDPLDRRQQVHPGRDVVVGQRAQREVHRASVGLPRRTGWRRVYAGRRCCRPRPRPAVWQGVAHGGSERRSVRDQRRRLPCRRHRERGRPAHPGVRRASARPRVRRRRAVHVGAGAAARAVAEPDPRREVLLRRPRPPARAERALPRQRQPRAGALGRVVRGGADGALGVVDVPADEPDRLSLDRRPARAARPVRRGPDRHGHRDEPERLVGAVRAGRPPVPQGRTGSGRRLGADACPRRPGCSPTSS